MKLRKCSLNCQSVALALGALLASQSPIAIAQAAPPQALPTVNSYAPMLDRVIPSVVTIRVIGETQVPVVFKPRTGDKPNPLPKTKKEVFRAGGSGVVVDAAKGLILTNNHVIENATKIEIGLSDGRRMPAELVGTDVGTDVAVIKVVNKKLPEIKIGDSDAVRVGDICAAVGNPFGLEGTATLGIVSAVMRTELGHGTFEDYLQIDAQINPGNSGGALVNAKGELIGINTAQGGGQGQNTGIGFAIPVNMALTIMKELMVAGRVRRGSPGLIIEDLSSQLTTPEGGGVNRGAVVTKVLPGSPGAKAGIKPGDIVVSANNKPVRTASEYITRVSIAALGSKIPMILFSKGEGKVVNLKMADIVLEPEEHTVPADTGSMAGAIVGEIMLGNPLYGNLRGVEVLKVPKATPAYSAGVEPGDIIIGINNAKVRSVSALKRRLAQAGMAYRVKIVRKGVTGWMRGNR